jgi:predicted TIM-barrel fold metal-dependent hydrolase
VSKRDLTTSRRELLKGLAAAGSGALLSTGALIAQNAKPAAGNPHRIDVHHHFETDLGLAPAGRGGAGRGVGGGWTPAASLEQMDKNGIAFAMLSHPGNGDQVFDGTEKGRAVARKINDAGAKIVSDHPTRFGLFAVLPMPDVDGSLKEIEYVYDTLKADGIGTLSNTGESWPGDPKYLPIFQELNRRKGVVFIHPFVNKCCRNLQKGVNDAVIEFDIDTTRAITGLLYNGVFSKCPEVRFIVNHSGAAVPALAGRIKDRVPGASTTLASQQQRAASGGPNSDPNHEGKGPNTPNGVFYELRRLYYECAHAAYPMPIAALTKLVPPTQYLFGTDYPAEPMESTLDHLPENGLSKDVMRVLNRGNAERLFPRLKS